MSENDIPGSDNGEVGRFPPTQPAGHDLVVDLRAHRDRAGAVGDHGAVERVDGRVVGRDLAQAPILRERGNAPLFPALGYGCWFLITTWLVPASAARNTGIVAARELKTGTWVRVHGMIGPIGQVARVQPEQETASSTKDSVERVRVSFAGGITTSWPHDHLLHTVEPQN